MNTILIVSSLILVIIAAIVTVYALKQEERKMKEYKSMSYEEAMKRSQQYEEESVATMLPVQIWTYVIGIVVTLIIIAVFAIYY